MRSCKIELGGTINISKGSTFEYIKGSVTIEDEVPMGYSTEAFYEEMLKSMEEKLEQVLTTSANKVRGFKEKS